MKQTESIKISRRRLFEMAGLSAAATLLARSPLFAQSSTTKPADLPTIKPGTNTSFGSLKQIDAGVLNVGYAEAGPADGPAGHSSARLALRHSQLCRCRSVAGVGGLPGDRAVSARLWHDALSFK